MSIKRPAKIGGAIEAHQKGDLGNAVMLLLEKLCGAIQAHNANELTR